MTADKKPRSKRKQCKFCKTHLVLKDALVVNSSVEKVFCDWACVNQWLKTDEAAKAGELVLKRDIRRRKDNLMTIHERMAEAQVAFNDYIRTRDRFKPCISCGAEPSEFGRGGGRDAGHYKSRASKAGSRFRFHPLNCWAQCKRCNRHLNGNMVDYRVNLVKRIGLETVEEIEQNQSPKKWGHTDLRRIKAIYKRKRKHYDRLRKHQVQQFQREAVVPEHQDA